MIENINNKVNKQPKSIINKEKLISSVYEYKAGKAQNLLVKIENLKLKASELNLSSIGSIQITNYIKNNKGNNIKLINNKLQSVIKPSNLQDLNLTYSDLMLDTELDSSVSNLPQSNSTVSTFSNKNYLDLDRVKLHNKNILKGDTSGFFLSLNNQQNKFNRLSNVLQYLKKGEIKKQIISSENAILDSTLKNKKVSAYNIRHYLNLLTKFEFKLSSNLYNIYKFKKSNKYLFAMKKATDLINLAFLVKGCLISKPIFNIVYSPNNIQKIINDYNILDFNKTYSNKPKIIIHLFYYIKTKGLNNTNKSNVTTLFESSNINNKEISKFKEQEKNNILTIIFKDKVLNLCDYLSKIFNAEVEFDLVRLYQPYQNSDILVQYFNSQSYNTKFINLVSNLFSQINIFKKSKINNPYLEGQISNNSINTTLTNESIAYPSGVSGVNIKLAGRPVNENIIPRLTVKRAQRGNFNRLNAKMIEKSMFTDRSRKGAFNFTISLSHVFR
uniref:Small ribosomal subunit protein uS3m n=1 Tax=Fomitiporia mediterranea TaxID=208960 RepID=A0A5B9RD38_9AGAM|nr:ribosomal protein S3 [Fomitiporia mediterranea]QEG57040.1 ribosomal protein S3 [Fomitiporia mediterranea]